MANSVKVKFPFDSRVATIPVNSALMKNYKSQVKNGTRWGFSIAKSKFLDENTCPANNNADVTAWFYPQFELMNFYATKCNFGGISACSYIDSALEALSRYKEAEKAYTQGSTEKEFVHDMLDVLGYQKTEHLDTCKHQSNIEPARDPNKFYKLGDFGAVYSFIKTAEDSEWNKNIDRMRDAY